jgi:hypothetical protein
MLSFSDRSPIPRLSRPSARSIRCRRLLARRSRRQTAMVSPGASPPARPDAPSEERVVDEGDAVRFDRRGAEVGVLLGLADPVGDLGAGMAVVDAVDPEVEPRVARRVAVEDVPVEQGDELVVG